MNQGRHQYPFSFTLPNEIPSSFEGVHGHVRYMIRAVFQRRRKWNHECKIPFTVNSIMDLNLIPESSVCSQSQAIFSNLSNFLIFKDGGRSLRL